MSRLFAVVLTALVAVGAFASSSFAEAAKVGKPAPAFTLKDQNGNDVSLEQFQGKIVVLEWFNDECPFVVKFYRDGHMNQWARSYMDKGVVWLAINSTAKHDVAHNLKVSGDWNIKHPLLSDQSGTVGRAYGAKTTPHMFIVNADGVLVYAGAIDSNRSPRTEDIAGATNFVAKALDELLAGKSVSEPETRSYGCSVKY